MVSFLRLQQCLSYFTLHPYLEMEPRFRSNSVNQMGEDQATLFAEHMRRDGPNPPEDSEQLQHEQSRFDAYVNAYFADVDNSLLSRFGLVPARFSASDLVTY